MNWYLQWALDIRTAEVLNRVRVSWRVVLPDFSDKVWAKEVGGEA